MRTATVMELKKELAGLPPVKLTELCLRLARFKKENKELLTYLLFEAHDEQGYIDAVKKDMDELFYLINRDSLYFAKKTIRKMLRTANKHTRYTGSPIVETELLIHFCSRLRDSGIPFEKSTVLANLYHNQLKKAGKTITALHEDLQHDYRKALQRLS
jgi:hypothetical protein